MDWCCDCKGGFQWCCKGGSCGVQEDWCGVQYVEGGVVGDVKGGGYGGDLVF